ncbi:MAG: threonine dehydratase, partial [Planctomycetota bacterium]
TGSFKVRGAVNRIAALDAAEREVGVVAASTGNHGAAVAFAAREAGVRASVVVPVGTPAGRVQAIEALGAEVIRFGAECGEAEGHGRQLAEEDGRVFLSPYNDSIVMAGQGTIGLELLEQVPGLSRVYVAVGGGGLIGGTASALKASRPDMEVIGCSPSASYPMHASVAAGCIVDTPHLETLSIATAGGLEEGSVTLTPCMEAVDRWELVDEDDIAEAVYDLVAKERLMVEGAVGVALAVWKRDHANGVLGAGTSCIVVCGGNLDTAHLTSIMARGPRKQA